MNCIQINIRTATFIILSLLLNGVKQLQIDEDNVEKLVSTEKSSILVPATSFREESNCPSDLECHKLGNSCIKCDYNHSCEYGSKMNVTCHAKVNCTGNETFQRSLLCRYCYQTEHWEHTCTPTASCKSVASPREYYTGNCTMKSEVLCLGFTTFHKRLPCNWTGGYRWSTALALSIALGGFGADRFYLGHWQEGIGKLFSFGGLGVWTLIDVILISLHYLGPADGSLYI